MLKHLFFWFTSICEFDYIIPEPSVVNAPDGETFLFLQKQALERRVELCETLNCCTRFCFRDDIWRFYKISLIQRMLLRSLFQGFNFSSSVCFVHANRVFRGSFSGENQVRSWNVQIQCMKDLKEA